ncbi:hypothetical protein [Leptospira ilyithenensis]|uniref:Uncharacterized protein n=1 Tax=Leptospira ilyithenensis TaxID=2484901 RepID=A0A4V3JWN0_9LEPT|nr:hypothetical protein [Leptospira ilyithenensis]TGN06879.1 hypothetical protein EHS11_17205 [Leptospira ilyithenensis]
MKLQITLSILFACLSFTVVLHSEKNKNTPSLEMNLHDFMEDYTKPATKLYDKKGNADYLNKILEHIPSLAPSDQQKEWKEIIDAKLAVGKPEDTCKSCHVKFKKDYKDKFRKKILLIPEELKDFPAEIKAALKAK